MGESLVCGCVRVRERERERARARASRRTVQRAVGKIKFDDVQRRQIVW